MKYVRRIVGIVCIITAAVFLITSIRKYSIEDRNPPEIQSTADEISVKCNAPEEELLAGLTAVDKEDGNLTHKIRVGGHSRFESPGVCDVEYLVFDSGYNVGKYTRKVRYTDYTPPVFSVLKPLQYQAGAEVSILGRLQASDCLEGDISGKIRILAGNVGNEEGLYTVTVEVSNSYGDIVSLDLPVYIRRDVTNVPVIELNTYLIYQEAGQSLNAQEYLSKVYNLDGSEAGLSGVKIISAVNLTQAGVYDVTYQYTDKNNRTGYTFLTVVVTEQER